MKGCASRLRRNLAFGMASAAVLGLLMPDRTRAAERGSVVPHAVDLAALGTVTLHDQQHRRVLVAEELARPGPVFVNFIFTSCGAVCPVMTAIFARLDRHLQREGYDARLYSVSIDPLEDTPDRLRVYAGEHRASPNWRFLTGTPAASEQVQRAFGAWRADRMSHPVATYLRSATVSGWNRVDGFASAEDLLACL